MSKNFMAKNLFFVLCILFCFALAGCTNSTALNTATYRETVDGVLWEVEYNTETGEVVSAQTPWLFPNEDISSPFHFFMNTNYERNTFLCVGLSAVPLKNDLYKITQSIMYAASGTRAEWETIKKVFPSCTYVENAVETPDPETGELTTEIQGLIIFSETSITYEQKIFFTVPTP